MLFWESKGDSSCFRLLEIRIFVRIRRCAAAEKAQRLCSHDRVPCARRDEDGIARPNHTTFAVELYLARAFENKIKLLRDLVIVPLCPAACLDARFRKALVLYGRIRAIEDRTDSRAVLRDKRQLGWEMLNGHRTLVALLLPCIFGAIPKNYRASSLPLFNIELVSLT